MKRPEILSPAGDLERLKFAVLYGADAVYVGATEFGMRSAPKNFTMEQLAEAEKKGLRIGGWSDCHVARDALAALKKLES